MAQTVDISDTQQTDQRQQGRRWKRFAMRAFFVVALAFVLGFVAFIATIERYASSNGTAKADAIVVLTGGVARLEPAVNLLIEERGERLLISGVNRQTSDALLQSALKIDDALYNCCVDIDQDAMDTVGNAVGTSHWVKTKGYQHIIVVTNDYHMPRAMMELRRHLGDVQLTPHAVRNSKKSDLSVAKLTDRYRVLIGEYGKLIAALGRGMFVDTGADGVRANLSSATGW